MLKRDIEIIYDTLEKLIKSGQGEPDTKFKLAMNKRKLNDIHESIKDARTTPPEYQEYEQKRIELCNKFARKNDKGQPVIRYNGDRGEFDIEDFGKFTEEATALKEEYKEAIDNILSNELKYKEMLKEEIVIDWIKIKLSKWPKVNDNSIDILLDMIEYDLGDQAEESTIASSDKPKLEVVK